MRPKIPKQIKPEVTNQSPNKTLFRGRHFSFLSVKTLFGFKEVIARNNENYLACKVLPLILDDGVSVTPNLNQKNISLEEFSKLFLGNNLEEKIKIPIFSVARPVSYFFKNTFDNLDVYEIPGGVVDRNENFEGAGVRELKEELGVSDGQIIAHSVLLQPSPFDAGSHVEFMAIIVVLLQGDINPVRWESIQGEKTEIIRFDLFSEFLLETRKQNRIIEGYVEFSYLLLKSALGNAKVS